MSRTQAEPSVYEGTFEVGAPRERVWAALTEPGALRTWFAERAEVDLREGGRFGFWGRHTPAFGGAVDREQRITALEPARRLAFDWSWGGAATSVEVALEDGAGATRVTVAHTSGPELHPCVPADFWIVAMANLDAYVRTGEPALLPDHSAYSEVAEVAIEIDAAAEAVWRTITDPAAMARWLGDQMPADPAVELRVGGVYTYGWTNNGKPIGPQEILEFEPGRRLVVSWIGDDGVKREKTEWLVEPLGESRTRLTVRQHGMADLTEFSGYANGWAAFLFLIRDQVEGR